MAENVFKIVPVRRSRQTIKKRKTYVYLFVAENL